MKDKINITLLISAFVLFAIGMIYASFYIYTKNNDTSQLFSEYNKIITSELNNQLTKQTEMDNKIIDIINNGNYTFESPCILENPYNISPLTALILFNTDEDTSISVTINDTSVTTYEASRNHIIPIVGLNSNATNIIKLTKSNYEYTELTITTDSLNEYISDLNVASLLSDKKNLMVLGETNGPNPYIRGFDQNNNLIYYLKFGNITKANFYSGTMQVEYNSLMASQSNSSGIKLDMDYLGRIYSINKSTEDITGGQELLIADKSYLTTPINIYDVISKNYDLVTVSDTTSPTLPGELKTDSLIEPLKKSKTYEESYELSLNGNFINANFQSDTVKLLLVSKKDKFTYVYDLNKLSVIKTNLKGDYAVYIIKDGSYYNLLTTLRLN